MPRTTAPPGKSTNWNYTEITPKTDAGIGARTPRAHRTHSSLADNTR